MARTRSQPEEILDEEHEQVLERVCAIDVAKAFGQGVHAGAARDRTAGGSARSGTCDGTTERGHRAGRAPGASRDREGHRGVHVGLLADLVLPAGGRRAGRAAGQRPRRQERPGPAQDRQAGRGMAGQADREGACCGPRSCRRAESGMLRDYTRLRVDLTHERTRHWQRLEKLLEDSLIKVSSVASTHRHAVGPGHDRGADRRANATRRCWPSWPAAGCRPNTPPWSRRSTGQFDDHHAELARILLDQIDALTAADRQAHRPDRRTCIAADRPPPTARHDRRRRTRPGRPGRTGTADRRCPPSQRLAEIPGIGPTAPRRSSPKSAWT